MPGALQLLRDPMGRIGSVYLAAVLFSGVQAAIFIPPYELAWRIALVLCNAFLITAPTLYLLRLEAEDDGNVLTPKGMATLGFLVFFPLTAFTMFGPENQQAGLRFYGVTPEDFAGMGLLAVIAVVVLIIFWISFQATMTFASRLSRAEGAGPSGFAELRQTIRNRPLRYLLPAAVTYLLGVVAVWYWLGGPMVWLQITALAFAARGSGIRFVGQSGYGYIEILNQFAAVGVIALLFVGYARASSNLGRAIVWGGALILNFCAFGYIGSRTAVLQVIIWLLILHSMFARPIPLRRFAISGLFVVLLAMTLNNIAHYANTGQRIVSPTRFVAEMFEPDAIGFIVGFDLARMLPTVVQVEAGLEGEVTLGSTYLAAALHPLPNYVWRLDRPMNVEQVLAARAGIDPYSPRSHPIVGMPGEAFLNFSWPGVVLLGFALGLLVVGFQRLHEIAFRTKNLPAAVGAVLLSFLSFSVTATQSFLLVYLLMMYGIAILFFAALMRIPAPYPRGVLLRDSRQYGARHTSG